MNTKLATSLSGGMVLVLALSGCIEDTEEKTNAWAKKVCDQVQPQAKKIEQANSSISQVTEGDKPSEEVKKTDVKAFQDISEAYASLADAVRRAGDPPVENGAGLRKDAVGKLDDLSKAYADLKKQAEELNADDQAEFADGLQEIAGELGELGRSGSRALDKLQQGGLGAAMAEQEGCRKPTPLSSASAA